MTDRNRAAYEKWLERNHKYIVEADFWPWLECAFNDAYDLQTKRIAELEAALAQLGHNNDRMIAILRGCIPYMKYPSDASLALVRAHDDAVEKAAEILGESRKDKGA